MPPLPVVVLVLVVVLVVVAAPPIPPFPPAPPPDPPVCVAPVVLVLPAMSPPVPPTVVLVAAPEPPAGRPSKVAGGRSQAESAALAPTRAQSKKARVTGASYADPRGLAATFQRGFRSAVLR
jgi:hypothetical protein